MKEPSFSEFMEWVGKLNGDNKPERYCEIVFGVYVLWRMFKEEKNND